MFHPERDLISYPTIISRFQNLIRDHVIDGFIASTIIAYTFQINKETALNDLLGIKNEKE